MQKKQRMYVIVKKGDETVLERGKKGASYPIIKEAVSGNYKLSAFLEKPQSNIKDIETFLRSVFEQDPERVIEDFESVLIDYLKYSFSQLERTAKAIRNSIFNKVRNLSGGNLAIVLKPFIIVRSSVRDSLPKPYLSLSKFPIIGIPIREYVRYEAEYKYKEIDSALLYLSTSDSLSSRFYKMLDEFLRENYNYYDYIYEIAMKKGKKGSAIENIISEALERLSSMFRGSDIERISRNSHSLRYKIVGGRLYPEIIINITPVQLPPSVDKRDVERTARRKIFLSIKNIFSEMLGVEEVEKYVDFSGVRINVNIRIF